MSDDEKKENHTKQLVGRDRNIHLRMSEYIFDGIPYIGKSFWSLSYPVSFARWAFCVDETSISNVTHQMKALFVANKLHDDNDVENNSNIVLRANCRFADYIYPFQLAERFYDKWVHAMKGSPFQSNREAVVEGVYPIHIDIVENTDPIQISINLHSDFWFPWCMGWTYDNPATSKDEMYDNRQLAWRHTPRLNQCLIEIRQLVFDINGTWEVRTEDVHEQYQHMVTETGIELGMPDDVRYLKNNE